MNKEIYEIENVAKNEGCFVSLLKYLTLGVVGFFVLWIMLLQNTNDMFFDYGAEVSAAAVVVIFGLLAYRAMKKSGRLYKITFNDEEQLLQLTIGNTFTGNDTEKNIAYRYLRLEENIKPIFRDVSTVMGRDILDSDKLSQNRKIQLYDKRVLVTTIDVDITAWCRHQQIDELIKKLRQVVASKSSA